MDYVIISEKLSEIRSAFDILEFDGTFSDIHCPVNAAFKSLPQILAHDTVRSSETVSMFENIKYKWNAMYMCMHMMYIKQI